MKLSGADGTCLTMVPVGLEFPDATGLGWPEDDWLVLEVNVTTARGAWSARAACVTTGEATAIAEWLRALAAGSVPVSLLDEDSDMTPGLSFLEPALAFSLGPGNDGLAHLRAHLNYALAPPWLDLDESHQMWKFFVQIALTNSEILEAASSWEAELAPILDR